jgi:hypothetical protein
VRGARQKGGFWYFYLYALLVKVPLGTLTLAAAACVAWVLPGYPKRKTELLLLISIGAVLGFVTCARTAQTVRYVLPVLPLLLIWASRTGRVFAGKRRLGMLLVAGCVGWSVLSSLWTYPHSLAYFNELAGGPARGHAHLVGPNIDWGQDYLYLKRFLDDHPEASPIGLSGYHPLLDPRELEIEYVDVPRGPVPGRWHTPTELVTEVGPLPGWYAVNVTRLREGSGGFAYFFRFRPVGHAGYSIYIYHITREQANRVRQELRLPELPPDQRTSGRSQGQTVAPVLTSNQRIEVAWPVGIAAFFGYNCGPDRNIPDAVGGRTWGRPATGG